MGVINDHLTYDEAEAAMCLWEECLNRLADWINDHGIGGGGPPLFDWLRAGEGMANARDMCLSLGPDIEYSYQQAKQMGFDDSFDWEFVPRWADFAMEVTEEHFLTPEWLRYIAYKVTYDWRHLGWV